MAAYPRIILFRVPTSTATVTAIRKGWRGTRPARCMPPSSTRYGMNSNVIEAGANYGWPEVEGIGNREGFVDPVQ